MNEGEPLAERPSAAHVGLTREDIDVTFSRTLHFDHADATRFDEKRRRRWRFLNAELVAQRREWVDMHHVLNCGRLIRTTLIPMTAQAALIGCDVEIVPGIRSQVTGGHTDGHQVLIIESEGESAVFLGDICSTSRHLPVLWCLGYDVHMQQTRRAKAKVPEQIVATNAIAIFDH